jgi:hypothetical protein
MANRRRPLPPQNRPRYLTPDQIAAVRQAWAAGLPRDEVCRQAGITLHVLEARRLDQLADLPKRRQGVGGVRRPEDPSEEEIWERITKEIQTRWTDEERQAAWEGSRRHRAPRH